MSGLYSYFREYLPHEEMGDPQMNSEAQYNVSLSALSPINDDESEELPPECKMQQWKEWRRQVSDHLRDYIEKRLIPGFNGDEEEVSDDDDNNNNNTVDETEFDTDNNSSEAHQRNESSNNDDNAPESQSFISQQSLVPSLSSIKQPSTRQQQLLPTRKLIPHEDETTREISLAYDMDLYTRTATFQLCQVQKIWRLRTIKRSGTHTPCAIHPPLLPGILPRQQYRHFEVDGPLGTCYDKVLSMEVVQLTEPTSLPQVTFLSLEDDDDGQSQSQQLVQQQQPPMVPSRFTLFFYNKYAEHMESLFDKDNLNTILSLEHVPARCIFPYSVDDRYFDSADFLPYCVCVGDWSKVKLFDAGSETFHCNTRFDTPKLKVRLAVGTNVKAKNNKVQNKQQGFMRDSTEILLTAELVQQDCPPVLDGSGPLTQAYQRWLELSQSHSSSSSDQAKPPTDDQAIQTNDDQAMQPTVGTSNARNGERVSTASALHQNPSSVAPLSNEERGSKQQEKSSNPSVFDKSSGRVAGAEQLQQPSSLPVNSHQTHPVNSNGPRNGSTRPRKRALADTYTADASNRQKQPPSHPRHYYTLTELWNILENHGKTNSSSWPSGEFDLDAAVFRFTSPSRTSYGDWMICLSVVDDSLPLPTDAPDGTDNAFKSVTANIFCKDAYRLPKLQRAGDVIRMHRVGLQMFNGEMQLLGRRASSYVVCRPSSDDGANWDIVPSAKDSFTLTPDDHDRFKKLWNWCKSRMLSFPTMQATHQFSVADMKFHESDMSAGEAHDSGDLTAMVGAIIPVPEERRTGATPMGYLRLWDGTGISSSDPLPMDTTAANRSIRNGDPPSQTLLRIASIIKKLSGEGVYTLTPDDPPKSYCGRVINAVIWEKMVWSLVTSVVQVGDFIRLRNVRDKHDVHSGMRCLAVHPSSSLTPLPDLTYEIRRLLEHHRERIMRKDVFNHRSGILPLEFDDEEMVNGQSKEGVATTDGGAATTDEGVVPGPTFDVHTLAKCIAAPAPSVFHVTVRVTSTIPELGSDCLNLRSICRNDRSGTNYVFRFALRLADESGEIDAIVQDSVGDALFGASASDVWRNPHAFVGKLRDLLVGNALFRATLRSVEIGGAKYFVLESI